MSNQGHGLPLRRVGSERFRAFDDPTLAVHLAIDVWVLRFESTDVHTTPGRWREIAFAKIQNKGAINSVAVLVALKFIDAPFNDLESADWILVGFLLWFIV